MKIILLSDTHNRHQELTLPPADIILHAGDITYFSKKGVKEVSDFIGWFANQDAKYKIFIGGNHDLFLEREEKFFRSILPEGVFYLNDESITIEGIKIWGSPVTPWFHSWAFNRLRGPDIKKHWDKIPDDVDILLTHGPAAGILDSVGGESVGCVDLLQAIYRTKPSIHCFGHIHKHSQIPMEINKKTIQFYNAAMVDSTYKIKNQPHIINFSI